MHWGQQGLARRISSGGFIIVFLFFVFGSIDFVIAKGICLWSNGSGCQEADSASDCAQGASFTDNFSCANYQKDGGAAAGKDGNVISKKGLDALKESVDTLTKAGGATKSLEEVLGGYIKTALVLVGTLFMALTFYGGYIWFIARDDEEEAKRAKSIISMALIGLIIVLAAYFVTYFIIYRLTAATGVGL